MIAFGEVGLSGEVRTVLNITGAESIRSKETRFPNMFVPAVSVEAVKSIEEIEIVGVKKI